MIDFQRVLISQKASYDEILMAADQPGCEYSFANVCLWGRKRMAFVQGCVVMFAHFFGRSVYPYPLGPGDRRGAMEEILLDARERGIPCRIVTMSPENCRELESWFPGQFCFRPDRDGFDYVYQINDLADLKGRKFQKKRNHVNRFWAEHPDCQVLPLGEENLDDVRAMTEQWYRDRLETDPHGDYLLEQVAMDRALRHYRAFGFEGLMLREGERILAMTMGTRLSPDTYDVHFEKANEDGAYAAVNREFARYLRENHPELNYLNREDDMGLEGLRKAKLSYNPHHMVEKYWACLAEDVYENGLSD